MPLVGLPVVDQDSNPAASLDQPVLFENPSTKSTDIYLHADIESKERALAQTAPADVPPGRYDVPHLAFQVLVRCETPDVFLVLDLAPVESSSGVTPATELHGC